MPLLDMHRTTIQKLCRRSTTDAANNFDNLNQFKKTSGILGTLREVYNTESYFNGETTAVSFDELSNYEFHPSTRFAAVLGLKHEVPIGKEPSWKDIRRQFLDHPLDGIFRVLFNIPLILIKLPELLVTGLRNFSALKSFNAKSKPGKYLGIGFYTFFSFILFFLRAVTSPVNNALSAQEFGERLFPHQMKTKPSLARRLLGASFALVSIAITAAAYAIIWPLGLKMIAAHVLPHVVNTFKLKPIIYACNHWAPLLPYIKKGLTINKGLIAFGKKLHHLRAALNFIGVHVSPHTLGLAASAGLIKFAHTVFPVATVKRRDFVKDSSKKVAPEIEVVGSDRVMKKGLGISEAVLQFQPEGEEVGEKKEVQIRPSVAPASKTGPQFAKGDGQRQLRRTQSMNI